MKKEYEGRLKLSIEDRNLVRKLRMDGVLDDAKGHFLDQNNGIILVTCSDGDQFFDIFEHQAQMQAGQQPADPRIHTFGWHGGALACAPCSPINERKKADLVFLDQIKAARKMKNIDMVALYTHAPCGAASGNGVNLVKAFALQAGAKVKIKTLNRGIKVACFFHVDYGNGVKRTYFFSRRKWDAWARENAKEER